VGEVDPLLHVAAYLAQGRDELRPLKARRDDSLSGQMGQNKHWITVCTMRNTEASDLTSQEFSSLLEGTGNVCNLSQQKQITNFRSLCLTCQEPTFILPNRIVEEVLA
jgi:hypothetical protein